MLQTTSTNTVSEQNEGIFTARSSKASAEVCSPPLTNVHWLLLSGQVSNTMDSTGKRVTTLGTICFCSFQHHNRNEKNLSRSACHALFPQIPGRLSREPGNCIPRILTYGQQQGSKTVQVHCCLLTTLQIQIKLVQDSNAEANIKFQVNGIFRLLRNSDPGRNYSLIIR